MFVKMKTWYTDHINLHSMAQGTKISLGIVVSILIAEFIGVDFAPSTGVVALLSIQDTKKKTVLTAVRRVITFVYTMFICFKANQYLRTTIGAFGLAVFLVVMPSVLLGWADTLSINIVIAVHMFIMNQPFDQHLMMNETYRVAIGLLVALVLNFIPLPHKKIQKVEIQDEKQ